MKAGIFLDGVQVGALKNWTLIEKVKLLSRDDRGRPSCQKIIGWTASAVRYRLNQKGLTGKELGFRFITIKEDQEFICKGIILTKNYKTGETAEGPLEMKGNTAPRIIWRSL